MVRRCFRMVVLGSEGEDIALGCSLQHGHSVLADNTNKTLCSRQANNSISTCVLFKMYTLNFTTSSNIIDMTVILAGLFI